MRNDPRPRENIWFYDERSKAHSKSCGCIVERVKHDQKIMVSLSVVDEKGYRYRIVSI